MSSLPRTDLHGQHQALMTKTYRLLRELIATRAIAPGSATGSSHSRPRPASTRQSSTRSTFNAQSTGCRVGEAVELSGRHGHDAFLTQPLTLKAGVTLLVDANVTLFGSANQADYDCDAAANWCTPLITVAPNTSPDPARASWALA